MTTDTATANPVWDSLEAPTRAWLSEEQQRHEIEAVDRGIERYRMALAKDPAMRGPEQRLACRALERLIPAVTAMQESLIEGLSKVGRPRSEAPAVLALPADKLSLLALQVMLSTANGTPMLSVYDAVARAMQREIEFEAIRKANKFIYKRAMEHTKRWTAQKISLIAKKAGIERCRWTHVQRLHVGATVVDLVLANCDLFRRITVRNPTKIRHLLSLTDESVEVIASMHERMEILSPLLMPMVVPPRSWDRHLRNGGYLFDTKPCVTVNDYDHHQKQDCPLVAEAINHCQGTAWRVNLRVLEVARTLWERGGGVAGLYRRDKRHMPPRPEGVWKSPAVRDWRTVAAKVHEEHDKQAAGRVATTFQLDFASKMTKYPACWFPHGMCFRGRAYTNASALNPQGNDLCRGLLEFAEAKPPGDDGVRALKIHMANCFGVDKVPHADRIQWTDSHLSEYHHGNHTFDPFEDRRWMDADDPFGALAAVLAVLEPGVLGNRLPVAVDGTCNGIQHLSALGLDRVGASSTNLLPCPRPADLYRSVLVEVDRLIDRDCAVTSYASGDDMPPCWAWKGKTSRTVTKQPVMTMSYGVTHVGMRSQIISNGCCDGLQGRPYQLAAYMQERIYEAIGSVIVASKEIMAWLRQTAHLCAEAGHPVAWTTPMGFIVNQQYVKRRSRLIRISNRKTHIGIPDADATVSRHAQMRGLSPNYIHSLDAAHMQATAVRCAEEGITFAATHDSYKTHACDVARMGRLLREEFVTMYHHTSLLAAFRREVMERTGVDLPETPQTGDLDMTQVLDSEYFFS